ncbi:hypothetical protein ACFC0C_07755 [Streptomyces sp. NPDC056178]|uniref:hypothetical protein n=1 Tax=unclassified Streptomyces TaxID=2593676 RepID=UPI0035E19EB0
MPDEALQGRRAVADAPYLVPRPAQMADDDLGDRRVVVHDEYVAARGTGGGAGSRGGRDVLHTTALAPRCRAAVPRRVDVRPS